MKKQFDTKFVPNKIQGEGDYQATRRYNEATRDFVKSGKVPTAARKAQPQTPDEEEELRDAEAIGLSHSKGDGPSV